MNGKFDSFEKQFFKIYKIWEIAVLRTFRFTYIMHIYYLHTYTKSENNVKAKNICSFPCLFLEDATRSKVLFKKGLYLIHFELNDWACKGDIHEVRQYFLLREGFVNWWHLMAWGRGQISLKRLWLTLWMTPKVTKVSYVSLPRRLFLYFYFVKMHGVLYIQLYNEYFKYCFSEPLQRIMSLSKQVGMYNFQFGGPGQFWTNLKI